MDDHHILTLGLNLSAPWTVLDADLDVDVDPHELNIHVGGQRGSLYPCSACGKLCPAHDFIDVTWQHLNFFQHRCTIHARVPRVRCDEHGVHRTAVPWARAGSGFTLLFEEMVITLCRHMPVARVAEHVGVTDHRLWRVIEFYVRRGLATMDLGDVTAVALDETASKKGHRYVTVFIDVDKKEKPVLFVTEGKDASTLDRFCEFMETHGGDPQHIAEVVCDMSAAFLSGVANTLKNAAVTVDWFHVVKLFTRGVDEVRRSECKTETLPKATRWAVLKRGDRALTDAQKTALAELEERGLATATAYQVKEQLRWVDEAETPQAMRWRITHFAKHWRDELVHPIYKPIRRALETLKGYTSLIIGRKASGHTNARLESLNGIFKAARAKARGYRNPSTFKTIIYLIAADLGDILIPRSTS